MQTRAIHFEDIYSLSYKLPIDSFLVYSLQKSQFYEKQKYDSEFT